MKVSEFLEEGLICTGLKAGGKMEAIDVMVDQMHGDGSGAALLVAYWDIGTDTQTRSFRFAETQPLADSGYDALVQAQEALLQRLAEAIAASLPAPAGGV